MKVEAGKVVYDDGAVLYTVDAMEYFKAIEEAPPGTLIGMGDLVESTEWMQCTECGSQMSKALTQGHRCGV